MSDPVSKPSVGPASTVRKIQTHGADATEALAEQLAPNLPADVTLGLRGPLGAGKTCFVRGLAEGLGIDPRQVASPTFVYLVDYGAGAGRGLHHGDLYRLGEVPEEAREEVFESIGLLDAVLGPDELCRRSGLAAGTVIEALAFLEVEGYVARVPGLGFRRAYRA